MIYCLDLDGTLVDSRRRHAVVLQAVLQRRHISCSEEDIAAYVPYKSQGKNTVDFLCERLRLVRVEAQACAAAWTAVIEEAQYLALDVLYEDTLVALRGLKERGKIVCLTARKDREAVLQEMADLKIRAYMDTIFVVSPLRAGPEKQAVVRELKKEDAVVVIGDTEVEYEAALEEGVACRVLNCGFRSKLFWEARGVRSFASLHEAIIGKIKLER